MHRCSNAFCKAASITVTMMMMMMMQVCRNDAEGVLLRQRRSLRCCRPAVVQCDLRRTARLMVPTD